MGSFLIKRCFALLVTFLCCSIGTAIAANTGVYRINEFVWHIENGYVFIDSITSYAEVNPNDKVCNVTKCEMRVRSSSGGGAWEGTTLFDFTNLTAQQVVTRLNSTKGGTREPATQNAYACPYEYRKKSGSSGINIAPGCSGQGVPPKPDPVTCSTNDVTLVYGEVPADSLSEKIANNIINVKCSGKATVHLAFSGYDHQTGLKLTDGLYSKIKLDGEDGDSGTNVTATNSTTVTIQSRLSVSGKVKPGEYSGSLVMKLNIL